MSVEYAGMGFVIALAFFLMILLVVVIWQGSRIAQTKMKVDAETGNNEAYRQLAEDSAAFQKQIAGDISDLHLRVAAIEKMLREV